jgi:thioredoxin 2
MPLPWRRTPLIPICGKTAAVRGALERTGAMSTTLKILCPQCETANRAPADKLAAGARGKCGRCGAPLFDGHPLALTEAGFDRRIAAEGVPIVVDFWAAWCGPCQAMAPMFERAAQRLEPRVRFAKLDTEAAPAIAARLGIRGIPTMILFRGGREIARQSGAMDASAIERWVTAHLDGRAAA